MVYYNQYNYPNVPYPSPMLPKATVKSGGCGVCCASMVLEATTGIRIPPEKMAPYAISVGARVNGGTDMHRLAEKLSEDYGIPFTEYNRIEGLISVLRAGGVAICNVAGDKAGHKGIFSNGGHYIVAAGIAADGRIIIYDPGMYEHKYASAYRRKYVEVSGARLLVDAEVLDKDCEGRSPRYYLFEGSNTMTQERFNELAKVWQDNENPAYQSLADVPEYWRSDVEELIAAGAIKGDGVNPVAMRRETLKAIIVAYRISKGAK